jgi:glycosyltransferase involved in cell wall biosynthesis
VKVLFLNPIGTLGGAEQVLLDLIDSLRRASPDLETEVLTLEEGPLLQEAAALGAATDVLPLPRALATLGESGEKLEAGRLWMQNARAAPALSFWLPRFAALLRRKRGHILHSNGLKTHLLAAVARPRGVPLIWHLHDFLSDRRLTARLLPLLQRRAALSIAVSQAVANDARTVLRGHKIETVLNGIRTELFAPGKVSPVDLDALAGLRPAPANTVRVGLVATYAAWKGHKLFLEAAHQVHSASVRFYIIGGPVYSTHGSQVTETELRNTIDLLGIGDRCGLVPFQAEVARVYAALDVVVQASTRPEPFGRTVAEAMSSGCVSVAFRAGGVPEQIDGKTGILVPPWDTRLLAQEIEGLIDSPSRRHQLGTEASRFARERLDSRRLGEAIATIYASLVGDR